MIKKKEQEYAHNKGNNDKIIQHSVVNVLIETGTAYCETAERATAWESWKETDEVEPWLRRNLLD